MKVDRSDIEKNLPRKGFYQKRSGDHIYFYHTYKGRETGIKTKLSHSKKVKDIADDLLTKMRKQLWLDINKQFVELVECPMSKAEYNSFLNQKGKLKLRKNT